MLRSGIKARDKVDMSIPYSSGDAKIQPGDAKMQPGDAKMQLVGSHSTPVEIHPPPDLDIVDPVEAVMLKTTERYASNFAENETLIYNAISDMRLNGECWCSLDGASLQRHSISEAKYMASRLEKIGYETRIVRHYFAWYVKVRNPDKVKACCVQ